MVTIVATWDHQNHQAQIHLSLDSRLFERDYRLTAAEQKVAELEERYGDQGVEVICAHARSLDEFRLTDPRFAGA